MNIYFKNGGTMMSNSPVRMENQEQQAMNNTDYEINVDVTIRNYQGNHLGLRETATIPNCTFEDMAKILHGFHEITTAVREANQDCQGKS
jgi:hypothetical protein